MGLFDRFRAKKAAVAPRDAARRDEPEPPTPAKGRIEAYAIADEVGVLRLADGSQIKFGRSACKGFEPVVGAAVVLEAVAARPRGWAAKAIALDPDDQGYDALMAARDEQLGLPARTMKGDEAMVAARELGVITVLLRDALPEGLQAVQRWAAERDLARHGVEVSVPRDLELSIDGTAIVTYAGRATFAADGLDARHLPDGFEYGRAFIGFGAGTRGWLRNSRLALQHGAPDVWAADGQLRQVSRLVVALAPHATGVILHRAGELVVPIAELVPMLGDLSDPACRPFAAWLDLAFTQHDGDDCYATFGMDAFGLPDVLVAATRGDPQSIARGHAAVLLACHRMIRENRELAEGESLHVPEGVQIGAWPVELPEQAAGLDYRIEVAGEQLRLRSASRS